MDPRRYVALFRRHWLTVAVFGVLGLMLAELHVLVAAPQYTASSVIYFAPSSASSPADLVAGSNYGQAQAKSYAQLADSRVVLNPVIKKYGLATSASAFAGSVSATTIQNTGMLTISVAADSPGSAATLANAVTSSLERHVRDLSPRNRADQPAVTASVIAKAAPPATASSPKITKSLALGSLGGLLLGLAAAMLRDRLDSTLRSADDVRRITPAPVLAQLAEQRGPSAVMDGRDGYSAPDSDSMRVLRGNLRFFHADDSVLSIAVTSTGRDDESSRVALNLADVYSETGTNVLLVDADHSSAELTRVTGVDRSIGLTSVLADGVPLMGASQAWGTHGLHVLSAGPVPHGGARVRSFDVSTFLAQARLSYEVIIIHTRPAASAADAMEWMNGVTGSLIVARLGQVRAGQLSETLDAAERAGCSVFGLVLSDVSVTRSLRDVMFGPMTAWLETRARLVPKRPRHAWQRETTPERGTVGS